MTRIYKHESKNCPRCKTEFECKAGSVLLRQCQTIVLSAEQLENINALFDDCLCVSCLYVFHTEYNLKQHHKRMKR